MFSVCYGKTTYHTVKLHNRAVQWSCSASKVRTQGMHNPFYLKYLITEMRTPRVRQFRRQTNFTDGVCPFMQIFPEKSISCGPSSSHYVAWESNPSRQRLDAWILGLLWISLAVALKDLEELGRFDGFWWVLGSVNNILFSRRIENVRFWLDECLVMN